MIETKDFTIKLPEDVGRFFFWLVFDCKINFHPDDNFADYVCEKTGEPTFNDKQADMYNDIMDECFEVCEKYNRDIYEIAGRVFKLYHYCDCNDVLANMGEESGLHDEDAIGEEWEDVIIRCSEAFCEHRWTKRTLRQVAEELGIETPTN